MCKHLAIPSSLRPPHWDFSLLSSPAHGPPRMQHWPGLTNNRFLVFFFSLAQFQVFTCGYHCLEWLKSTTFALLLVLGKAVVVQHFPHTEPGSSFDAVCGHGYRKCGQRVRCVAPRPRPSPGARRASTGSHK